MLGLRSWSVSWSESRPRRSERRGASERQYALPYSESREESVSISTSRRFKTCLSFLLTLRGVLLLPFVALCNWKNTLRFPGEYNPT